MPDLHISARRPARQDQMKRPRRPRLSVSDRRRRSRNRAAARRSSTLWSWRERDNPSSRGRKSPLPGSAGGRVDSRANLRHSTAFIVVGIQRGGSRLGSTPIRRRACTTAQPVVLGRPSPQRLERTRARRSGGPPLDGTRSPRDHGGVAGVAAFTKRAGRPRLAIVLVGDESGSALRHGQAEVRSGRGVSRSPPVPATRRSRSSSPGRAVEPRDVQTRHLPRRCGGEGADAEQRVSPIDRRGGEGFPGNVGVSAEPCGLARARRRAVIECWRIEASPSRARAP